jgi:hypothetical protein
VHFGSPRWIEVQTRYLREHVRVPYKTWTSLQHIDPSYSRYFDVVIEQQGSHAGKLNHLANEILHTASDEDLLMFLDGDAFPIADPMPLVERSLAQASLVAVRRRENAGDPQPHPCFATTTVGSWRKLAGDWSGGHTWVNETGERVSDVGGNLLRKLELTGTPWVEVLRSNRKDLDPIFFGIYGGVVYHHGAGFRGAHQLNRLHISLTTNTHRSTSSAVVERAIGPIGRYRRHARHQHVRRRLSRLSASVYARIKRGDDAWLAQFE